MGTDSGSVYRDRTSEFLSLSKKLKKVQGHLAVNGSQHGPAPPIPSALSYRSEFTKRASGIGLGIQETTQKVSRLAKLARRSSMFDDPIMEIQELSALIKDEITTLNIAVSNLQALQNMEMVDGNYSEDKVVHSATVCDDLKNKLMGATKQFQDVLTTRTENIKAHESRKQIFSANASRENPLRHQTKQLSNPLPWSTTDHISGNLQQAVLPTNGVQASSQLRRRLAAENNTPSLNTTEVQMSQQVMVPRLESYTQSRAVALQNVESTISELGGIFTQLATMVAQQGELAIRIDDNMDESLTNVESARSALLKHLNQITSNRWLLIKIFAILIFFLMVFLFFLV